MSETNECKGCLSYHEALVYNGRNSQCKSIISRSKCPCQICLVKMVCVNACLELSSHISKHGHHPSDVTVQEGQWRWVKQMNVKDADHVTRHLHITVNVPE